MYDKKTRQGEHGDAGRRIGPSEMGLEGRKGDIHMLGGLQKEMCGFAGVNNGFVNGSGGEDAMKEKVIVEGEVDERGLPMSSVSM